MMGTRMTALITMLMLGGLNGCGKTITELKSNSDAVVDNTAGTVSQVVSVVGGVVKKVIGIAPAAYEVGKKVVEDSKDNVVTVTGGGASK